MRPQKENIGTAVNQSNGLTLHELARKLIQDLETGGRTRLVGRVCMSNLFDARITRLFYGGRDFNALAAPPCVRHNFFISPWTRDRVDGHSKLMLKFNVAVRLTTR